MLEAFAFVGVLDEPDVEWLVTNSKWQEIQSGTVLIRQGEPVESLYLIVDGAFDVTLSVPNDHQVARLYSGELMGEMSFVDLQPPSATVTAGMNSGILAIARADLTRKIENDVGFAVRFYKGVSLLLSGRLRAVFAQELDLQGDPEGRDEMGALKIRFEEIQRRFESRRFAKGA